MLPCAAVVHGSHLYSLTTPPLHLRASSVPSAVSGLPPAPGGGCRSVRSKGPHLGVKARRGCCFGPRRVSFCLPLPSVIRFEVGEMSGHILESQVFLQINEYE